MKKYELPPSLKIGLARNATREEQSGKLLVTFGGGSLLNESYEPLGLDALWRLVGTVASLGESFTFEVEVGMNYDGFYGGFADGKFCLFDIRQRRLEVLTRSAINPVSSETILFRDENHDIGFRIPSVGMISFEEMVAVGNAFLLSSDGYTRTRINELFPVTPGSSAAGDRGAPLR